MHINVNQVCSYICWWISKYLRYCWKIVYFIFSSLIIFFPHWQNYLKSLTLHRHLQPIIISQPNLSIQRYLFSSSKVILTSIKQPFFKFYTFRWASIRLQIRNLSHQIRGITLFETANIHFSLLFISCQFFCEILQVCSFVCFMCVCVSVCKRHDNSWTIRQFQIVPKYASFCERAVYFSA